MLFQAAVAWLRQRRVLLPGLTLVRLVTARREAATQQLWEACRD